MEGRTTVYQCFAGGWVVDLPFLLLIFLFSCGVTEEGANGSVSLHGDTGLGGWVGGWVGEWERRRRWFGLHCLAEWLGVWVD